MTLKEAVAAACLLGKEERYSTYERASGAVVRSPLSRGPLVTIRSVDDIDADDWEKHPYWESPEGI